MTSSTENIDAIFDLAADTASSNTEDTATTSNGADNDNATQDTSATAPEGNADNSAEPNPGLIYHRVLKTLTASQVGEGNPEGTFTIAEFANFLSVEAIKAGGGMNDLVPAANIYTASKGSRNPLPVYLVFADDADTTDHRNVLKVYIPIAEGTEAWNARPTKGESNASTSKRTKEELLEDAAKKLETLTGIQTRRKRAEEQEKKATAQFDKYLNWLREYYKDATPVEIADEAAENGKRMQTRDEAVSATVRDAIEGELEKLIAKREAEKGVDIPDADNK